LLRAEDMEVEATVIPTDLEAESVLQELIRREWEELGQEGLDASAGEQAV
jgi:hypothetical protein